LAARKLLTPCSRASSPAAVQIAAGIRDRPVRRLRQRSSRQYTFFIGIGTSDSATVTTVSLPTTGDKTHPNNPDQALSRTFAD